MKRIISASRRTDIPRYFGAWFARRREAGWAGFRNAFGVAGEVSLRDEDVLGYLFWTRFSRPFRDQLQALSQAHVPYVFQYTITGYGRPLEQHTPPAALAIADFRALSRSLPGPSCIQWRYDPIVVSKEQDVEFHLRNFAALTEALAGATKVVNCSIVEPYVKTVRRVGDDTVRYRPLDPRRHKSVAKRHPHLGQAGEAVRDLLRELSTIAADKDMELRACCNPEWGLPPSRCAGADLFEGCGVELVRRLSELPPAPSRPTCQCFATVDIGMADTCVAGCRYCYVVASQDTAVANFRRHDRRLPQLRAPRTVRAQDSS